MQPYLQENLGRPVMTYVVSNVKELPQKGAKIVAQLRQNIEATIVENTNYSMSFSLAILNWFYSGS